MRKSGINTAIDTRHSHKQARRMCRLLIVVFVGALGGWLAAAQEQAAGQTITRPSADAVELVADWHAAAAGAPVVLSLHMLNSQRSAYAPLLPDLLAAGYAVLNVDMRGHGNSAGQRDWDAAIADVGGWLAWLEAHEHLSDAGVALLGASIGANVAIISCAQQAACRGALALSPGLDYRGTKPESALAEGYAERRALLVAAQGDSGSANSVRQFFASAAGDVTARILPGRAHGTRLFDSDYETISRLLLHWLGEHLPVPAPEPATEGVFGDTPEKCGLTDYTWSKRNSEYILCSSVPIDMRPVRVGDCLYEFVDDRDGDDQACGND